MSCTCRHGMGQHYLDYAGPGVCGGIPGKCLEDGCPCQRYMEASGVNLTQSLQGPKRMMEFPKEQWDAWTAGYLWGQKAIVDTMVAEEKARFENVMGHLRASKMAHGLCQPRSRKACTACNAQDELDRLLSEWKGFTITATGFVASPEVTA